MRRTFLLITFLLGAMTFTRAADVKKEIAAMGWGTITCTAFANMYRDDPKVAEEHSVNWAQGFMSGLNFANLGNNGFSMNLHSKSTDQQQRAIRAYCNDHPIADYIDAVLDLYTHLDLNVPDQH